MPRRHEETFFGFVIVVTFVAFFVAFVVKTRAMLTRKAALTAIVLAGTITALIGQARQGGGPPPAQLTIQPVKPGSTPS